MTHRRRIRRGVRWIAAVALTAATATATACGTDDRADDRAPERSPAPDYTAIDVATGETASLADLRGEAVLLAGWATWCVPCERELPELQEYADTEAPEGLRIVAVNVDDAAVDDAEVTAMTERLAVTFPVWRDPEATLLGSFGGFAMPFSVLIDPDGRVVRTWNGALDPTDDVMLDAIDAALA